jgi:trimethylamine--corrinoid protein Co-methyltransferase
MSDTEKLTRRRRTSRSERGQRKVIATPAYIKRVLPFFDPLDEEQLVRLEEQADWLIQEKALPLRMIR